MRLKLDTFGGIAPGIDPTKIPVNLAQTAQNVNIEGNVLDVTYQPTKVLDLPDNTRNNIYKYEKNCLYCGTSGTLQALQGVTSGSFSIYLSGKQYTLSSLNFSGNTKTQMASEMQTALRTATSGYESVEYDSTNDRFIFSSYSDTFSYLVGTLSSATYLNGATGGTATIVDNVPEWLSFTEEHINVVKSPVIQDTYGRIYYTGASGGKLKMHGSFGTRDVGVPVPASAPTVSGASVIPTDFACEWVPPAGYSLSNVECGLISSMKTSSGWTLTFNFPGQTKASSDQCTDRGYWSIDFYGETAKVAANVGTPYTLSNGNIVTMSSMTYPPTTTSTGSLITWYACTVTIIIDIVESAALNGEFYYVYRYVTDLGEQGGGSPVSAKITGLGGTVTMARSSDSTVKKIRLYRTKAGTDAKSDNFYFVTEQNNPTNGNLTYADTVNDLSLVEGYSRRQAPPDNLQGLVAMPSGFLAAFKDNLVYRSDLFLPHSWSADPIPTEHDIVGLAVSGNDLVVLTKGYPYLMSGTNPAAMRSSKLMENRACVSARGICNVGNSVFYPCQDGLAELNGSQVNIVTEGAFQRSNWQSYVPSSMISGTIQGKLYMFMTGGNLILSSIGDKKTITSTDDSVSGLFSDIENDILYVIQNGVSAGAIYSLNTSATAKQITYKSKKFKLTRPVTWSAIKVNAESYPVYVNIYANQVKVLEMTINSSTARRLPETRRETVWELEILANYKIFDVAIADNIEELGK